jgi:hypothetical protein
VVAFVRLKRPYIPLAVRVAVSEKLVRSLGGMPFSAILSMRWRLGWNLNLAARIKGLPDGRSFHCDHDPPLGTRPFSNRTGKYKPDANDPEHLFYRSEDDHRTKTFVRGEHGQYSDIVLIKRERRRNRPAKPKRKIPSRPFSKRKKQ